MPGARAPVEQSDRWLRAASLVGCDAEIASVLDCETTRTDETIEAAVAHHENVVDDFVRRCDLAVAVVPGELKELQEVQCRRRQSIAERSGDPRLSLSSAFGTADGHRAYSAAIERRPSTSQIGSTGWQCSDRSSTVPSWPQLTPSFAPRSQAMTSWSCSRATNASPVCASQQRWMVPWSPLPRVSFEVR